MIFTLEALEARHGDCLLLHYGTRCAPRLLLIDGGTRGVYRRPLRDRLQAIRAVISPGAPLRLRMILVSHIDDDHVKGVLDLGRDLERRRQRGEDDLCDVITLWHNSFDDLVPRAGEEPAAALAAAAEDLAIAAPAGRPFASQAIFQSVPQGRDLRNLAVALDWRVNDEFRMEPDRLVMAPAGEPGRGVDLGDGLTFTVLGPREEQVRALQAEWDRVLVREGLAAAAGSVDTSVFNLASIVVLARVGERSMLLTGDARQDHVVEGLAAAGLLAADGGFHCDLLKMPHHGSARNVSEEFLRRVTADHYVISANGRDDNPDLETLELLSAARGEDVYTVWLTNAVPHAVEFYDRDRARPERHYRLELRADDAPGIGVHLGDDRPLA